MEKSMIVHFLKLALGGRISVSVGNRISISR